MKLEPPIQSDDQDCSGPGLVSHHALVLATQLGEHNLRLTSSFIVLHLELTTGCANLKATSEESQVSECSLKRTKYDMARWKWEAQALVVHALKCLETAFKTL